MAQVVFAAFRSQNAAEHAIDELETLGYNPKEISVVTKDARGTAESTAGERAGNVAEGATSGAATGGIIGGLAGLLAGAGILPGLAGLLIGGPIAAALGATGIVATTISGAVTGAVAGGLIGALTGLGIPEEDAKYYDETIKSGGYMVAVPSRTFEGKDVKTILKDYGADRIDEVNMDYEEVKEELS